MSTPSAWIVDLDGTLYSARPLKLRMALELGMRGLAVASILRTFRHQHELLRQELGAQPELQFSPSPLAEQVHRTARLHSLAPSQVEAIVVEWMIRRPTRHLRRYRREALVTEIRAFRAAGGRTALVSDYPAREKLAALDLTDSFDAVVANGEHAELQRLKPSPDGVLIAARALGEPPERCLVVGDRPDADGAAAQAAGMSFRLIR